MGMISPVAVGEVEVRSCDKLDEESIGTSGEIDLSDLESRVTKISLRSPTSWPVLDIL